MFNHTVMMNEMNSYSAMSRMRNRLGINKENGFKSSTYIAVNRIKRELSQITKEDYAIIKKNVYKENSKVTMAAMIDMATTRVERLDEPSLYYMIRQIEEVGIIEAVKLFYIPLAKLHTLATKAPEYELRLAA